MNNLKNSKPHVVNKYFFINNVKLEKDDLKFNNTNNFFFIFFWVKNAEQNARHWVN